MMRRSLLAFRRNVGGGPKTAGNFAQDGPPEGGYPTVDVRRNLPDDTEPRGERAERTERVAAPAAPEREAAPSRFLLCVRLTLFGGKTDSRPRAVRHAVRRAEHDAKS